MSQLDKDGPADVISEYVDRWVNERLLRQLPEEVTPTHSSALGDPKIINGNVHTSSSQDASPRRAEEGKEKCSNK
jgi:hypothetical protein